MAAKKLVTFDFTNQAPEVTLHPPSRPRSASAGASSRQHSPLTRTKGTWSRAARFSAAKAVPDSFFFQPQARGSATQIGGSAPSKPATPRPWKACPRPPSKGGEHCPPDSTSTWLDEDQASCSIPSTVSKALHGLWRQAAKQTQNLRFMCIVEACHSCDCHATTTKHDPEKYEGYSNAVKDWVTREYSFIEMRKLHIQKEHLRIGALEVYLLMSSKLGGPVETFLLHSKLASLKWPCKQNLVARLEVALPSIVARARSTASAPWDAAAAAPVLQEVHEWGLRDWGPAAELANKGEEVTTCLDQGKKASEAGNTKDLRLAVQKGLNMELPEDVVSNWREVLKGKNMLLFGLKAHARRLHNRASLGAAVKGLARATAKPLRLAVMEEALDRARAVEVDDDELQPLEDLLSACNEELYALNSGVSDKDMQLVRQSLANLEEMDLRDDAIEEAQLMVKSLADGARMAKENHDLLKLNELFEGWEGLQTAAAPPDSSWADISASEAERRRLQALVDQAEERFTEKRWDALQSVLDRLKDARVDGEAWERWTSTLKRERSWVIIKAVSGTAPVLRNKLHTARLQAAVDAPSIQEAAFEKAILDSEQHANASLVEQARSELEAARKRWTDAEAAVKKGHVDVAEVTIWKMQSSRIQLRKAAIRTGPLWKLAEAVHSADATQDWEALQQAIEGWTEAKPGSEHKAFSEENSPTKAYRHALQRIPELKLQDMKSKLDAAVGGVHAGLQPSELENIRHLVKEMHALGWEMPPSQRARVLALREALQPAGRLGLALLRVVEAPARVVLLLDQSKSVRAENFNDHMKPMASKFVQEMSALATNTMWGAVAYGPMKMLHELTKDIDSLNRDIVNRKFGNGDRTTAKAMRKAFELFKSPGKDDHPMDAARIVLNFTAGEPENPKDAEKTLKQMEANGITVVGVGIGSHMSEDQVAKISSAGLAFHAEGFNKLQAFMDKAVNSVRTVLDDANSLTTEAILTRLAA